ncbi:MAG: VanZ family protein [Burkholderiaceae bacterium]
MSPSPTPLQRLARRLAAGAGARHAWRALLLALVVVISGLALTPEPSASASLGWDKLNHAASFAALAFAAWLGFAGNRGTTALVLAGLLAFGASIEIAQSFIPSRSSEWGDLLADAIGLACGALLAAAAAQWATTARMRPDR